MRNKRGHVAKVKVKCPYCGNIDKCPADKNNHVLLCVKCWKRFAINNGVSVKIADEDISIESSDLTHAELPPSEAEKINVSLDPKPLTPPSSNHPPRHSTDAATLRNQMTIVHRGRASETIDPSVSDSATVPPAASYEREPFSLPLNAGTFVATDILAQGGMGTTYIGHKSNDPSAKAVIKVPDASSPKIIEMFSNECKLLEDIHHPNIVPCMESGEFTKDGRTYPFMVMKFIDGQSLRQRIKTQGKLSWVDAAKVLDDIASALKYLYDNNFCHRDIKPDNIIFDTETHSWILVDFGIAKSLLDNLVLTMTRAGQDSGTWDYMPPEQLEGKVVDIRCDIYALGTVVWEALIGTVPRRGTKLPAAFGLELSEDVDVLIGKMVEHNLDDRYQTPDEVLHALRSGAKRVEVWKETKAKARHVFRISFASLVIIVLIAGVWLIGDFVMIAKAKEVYETNKSSATIALRELKILAAKTPLYLGQRYIASQLPDLEKKAVVEQTKMKNEYAGISNSIANYSGTDEELERRKLQCDNFVIKWEKIFENNEVNSARQNINILENILKQRKEMNLVGEIITQAKGMTASKEDTKYKEALDMCNRRYSTLTLPETITKLGDYIATLKKDAVREALLKIKPLVDSENINDWLTADRIITESKEITDDDELNTMQVKSDDKCWKYCVAKAHRSSQAKNFSQAHADLELYEKIREKSGLKRHTVEVIPEQEKIHAEEETSNWDETNKRVDQCMNDNNYIEALESVRRFKNQYPTTCIDVAIVRTSIADIYAKYIISKRSELDDYQEDLKVFLQQLPDDAGKIKILRNNLCWSVRQRINKIINSESVTEAKTALLTQIKFTDCEQYQKDYLRTLLSAAIDYTANNNNSTLYSFNYIYQRPPPACIEMKQPTTFKVTITSIQVDFSDSDYSAYRGGSVWDSDPQIELTTNTGDTWTLLGPVNQQSFSVSSDNGKAFAFFLDTEGEEIFVEVTDSDNSIIYKDGPRLNGSWKANCFIQSGTDSHTLRSGTKITLQWTTE